MPMPEAAIYEDASAIFPHHDVRMPWQSRMIQPIAEPMPPQPFAHNDLRLCVLAMNGRHVGMALLCGEFIHKLFEPNL